MARPKKNVPSAADIEGLHFSINAKRLNEVKKFFDRWGDGYTEVRNISGLTPLLTAAQFQDENIIKFLLERGASIDFAKRILQEDQITLSGDNEKVLARIQSVIDWRPNGVLREKKLTSAACDVFHKGLEKEISSIMPPVFKKKSVF